MHGTIALTTLDFGPMREALHDGRLKLSANCAEVVAFIRSAAEQYRMPASYIATNLSSAGMHFTRAAVCGLSFRVVPKIIYDSDGSFFDHTKRGLAKRKHGNYCGQSKTRRQQRAQSHNLSTHAVRLQRKVDAVQPRFYETQSVRTGTHSSRKMHTPVCLWAGCKATPMRLGKPYCEKHHTKSGAMSCDPLNV